jgi:uncharacterized protein YxjI
MKIVKRRFWQKGGASMILIALLLLLSSCSHERIRLTPLAEDANLGNTYVLKEKFWTLADQYIIKNDQNKPLFQVKGKFFSIGDKLSLCDMAGSELVYISEQVISLLKRYRITRPDGSYAVFRQDFHLFNDKFTIKLPGEASYVVRGNFWDHEYSFYRQGRLVAVVSKKLFSWTDAYAIQVVRGEDDLLILAAAVVIDKIKENEEQARHIDNGQEGLS